MLKDKIRMEDIVTIRASRDCYFQIFLSNSKIVQFRSDTMDSQVRWMALLKVGLGRGAWRCRDVELISGHIRF